jgi:DNA-binding response OmpR family regulator
MMGMKEALVKSILLLEDEEHLALTLKFNLEEEGYRVFLAQTIKEAEELISERKYVLMLLDVMLPDGDGMDLCQAIRESGDHTPVLMLTAKGGERHIVAGLQSGADDYLKKPFGLAELLSRIEAILRRNQWTQVPMAKDEYAFGHVRINFRRGEVTVSGAPLTLTALEMRLLEYFVRHENDVISRENLLSDVWGMSTDVNTRTIDNFIVRIRRMFELDPTQPVFFRTVHGVGYRFVPIP